MAARGILLVTLASLFFTGILTAGGAPTLSGSKLQTKDALTVSKAVIVGKVNQLGWDVWTNPIYSNSIGTKVRVLQVLRGSIKRDVFVNISASCNDHEALPTVSETYIFFINSSSESQFFIRKVVESGEDQFTALKLLHATDANIALVKKLISN